MQPAQVHLHEGQEHVEQRLRTEEQQLLAACMHSAASCRSMCGTRLQGLPAVGYLHQAGCGCLKGAVRVLQEGPEQVDVRRPALVLPVVVQSVLLHLQDRSLG